MRTATFVYAALFGVALIASYFTWTAAPEPIDESGDMVLLDIQPKDLAKVTFESSEVDVELTRKTDELGTFVWVDGTRRLDSTKPTPTRPATDGPAVLSEEKFSFKGGKSASQLLDAFAPMKVKRRLDVAEDDLDRFGLAEANAKLTLERTNGTAHVFEVGDTAYGHTNLYLREVSSGDIFVFTRTHIVSLERADTRLPEKELFEGTPNTITAASISAPNGSLELVQRNRDDAAAASWTAPNSETVDSTASAWLDKLFRLRATHYAADPTVEKEPIVTVRLTFADRTTTTIEIFRGTATTGEAPWFAQSEFTRGLVHLSSGLAADAAADVATLFDGTAP